MLMPIGFINSSARISPGWIGSSSLVGLAIGTSVIVHYFNVMRLAIPPDEADPPLIVDPNTVLSSAISLERFEMVPRWNTKIIELPGGMKVEQFAPRHA